MKNWKSDILYKSTDAFIHLCLFGRNIILESAPSMYLNQCSKICQCLCWDFVCLLFFVVAILKMVYPNTTIDIPKAVLLFNPNIWYIFRLWHLFGNQFIHCFWYIGKGFLRHLGIWRKLDLQLFWTHTWNNLVLHDFRWASIVNIYINVFLGILNVFELVYSNSWRICLWSYGFRSERNPQYHLGTDVLAWSKRQSFQESILGIIYFPIIWIKCLWIGKQWLLKELINNKAWWFNDYFEMI